MSTMPAVRQVVAGVCPSCDGTEFSTMSVPERGVTIAICAGCNLYINLQPTTAADAAEAGFYDTAYHQQMGYDAEDARKIVTNGYRLHLLENLRAPGAFLDVGCSLGTFVEAARRRGWDAHGADISADVVAACRRRGLQATVGDMRHLDYPDNIFDAPNLRHVLEHDVQLWECLAELRRVLKPGGLLYLEVPCVDCIPVRRKGARYIKFWHDFHCYWFSRQSIRNILGQAGFTERALPRFGRGALANPRYLLWLAHRALMQATGRATYDVSVWEKTG